MLCIPTDPFGLPCIHSFHSGHYVQTRTKVHSMVMHTMKNTLVHYLGKCTVYVGKSQVLGCCSLRPELDTVLSCCSLRLELDTVLTGFICTGMCGINWQDMASQSDSDDNELLF